MTYLIRLPGGGVTRDKEDAAGGEADGTEEDDEDVLRFFTESEEGLTRVVDFLGDAETFCVLFCEEGVRP